MINIAFMHLVQNKNKNILLIFTTKKEKSLNRESPLVSFIVAVYNDQDHILKSINSIINQTYNHLEIIVVDDCSNDQTKNILASIKDERLKVIRNDENLGLTKSLNIAIQHTNGQYLARQDSDDYSAAHRIETQLSFIKDNPNVKLVGSNYFVVDYIGKNIKTSNNLPVTDRKYVFTQFSITLLSTQQS